MCHRLRPPTLQLLSSVLFIVLAAVAGQVRAQVVVDASVEAADLELHQPRIPYSGRVNSIAIDPLDERHVVVATESGGLFESHDDGASWRHVDSLPVWWLNDVHFIPDNPGVILVTAWAGFDFHNLRARGSAREVTTSGGGIWISRDGGARWEHPASAVPAANELPAPGDRTCPPRLSAYGASIDEETGRIFVATDCGILMSDDVGVSWRRKRLPYAVSGDSDAQYVFFRRFLTVAALEGRGVVAGGLAGVYYSDDNGEIWRRTETAGMGSVRGLHAAVSVPDTPGQAFMVTSGREDDRVLWRSYDSGRTWQRREGPGNAATCGGIDHVYATMTTQEDVIAVYYGNTCATYLTTMRRLGPPAPLLVWVKLAASHPDTRAMAFLRQNASLPPAPAFLGSDGGLDTPAAGGFLIWEPVGSGPGKLNALQLYGVSGQVARGEEWYRLAFGTQDNDLWSSADEGVTWPPDRRDGPELFGMQMKRRLDLGEPDKWTYVVPGQVRISDPFFQNPDRWPGSVLRPGCGFGTPKKTADDPGWYSQFTFPVDPKKPDDPLCAEPAKGLEATFSYGSDYFRVYDVPEEVRGAPAISNHFVQYLAVARGRYQKTPYDGRRSYRQTHLLRLSLLSAEGEADYPDMTDFGSMGHYAYQFAWEPVFAVDPHDENHIIAPDVVNVEVKVSIDGGNHWTKIPGLIDQVTQGGRLRFSIPSELGDFEFSLVSAISFFPENPELVILGLQQGGAFISADGGTSWNFVHDSDRISNITGFHWKSANEIYVASYGRGLWKISAGSITDLSVLVEAVQSGKPGRVGWAKGAQFDSGMRFVPLVGSDFAWGQSIPLLDALQAGYFDTLVAAVNGTVSGLSDDQTIERRVKVTPGTSRLLFAQSLSPNIEPARASMAGAPEPTGQSPIFPDDQGPVVGVAFSGGEVVGVATGAETVYLPPDGGPKAYTPGQSPTLFDGPYVTLQPSGRVFTGGPVYDERDSLDLRGHNFDTAGPVEILVDGELAASGIQVDSRGEFAERLPLSGLAAGVHQLEVLQRKDSQDETVDRRIFLISNNEDEESANDPPIAICRDVMVTAEADCSADASIDNGSYDAEGDPISLDQSPPGPYPLGDSVVSLTVTDSKGASSQCEGTVTVADATAPSITAVSPTPPELWPPNHQMVEVYLDYTIADNCGQPSCRVSRVTSNEPITTADYTVVDASRVLLRAERLGEGRGRLYDLTVTCVDNAGNSSDQSVQVLVPHDQQMP